MKFQPVSHSWVALHPKPQGVVQFIGGAFFGTFFPMLFYRSLLQCIFDCGYTIILLPFNFTFDHYTESGFLIREQYKIMPELVRMAISSGFDCSIYLNDKKFSWVGHSIGCKYIALLEGLTALPISKNGIDKHTINETRFTIGKIIHQKQDSKKVDSILADLLFLVDDLKSNWIKSKQLIEDYIKTEFNYPDLIKQVEISSIFIKDQPSLLLDPVNTGLEAAIPEPFSPVSSILINLGLNVKPTPEETKALIKEGNLFNLLSLISFEGNGKPKKTEENGKLGYGGLAESTCHWFDHILHKPPAGSGLRESLTGGHLRPLGIRLGRLAINFPDPKDGIPLIETMKEREDKFESIVIRMLHDLLKLVK